MFAYAILSYLSFQFPILGLAWIVGLWIVLDGAPVIDCVLNYCIGVSLRPKTCNKPVACSCAETAKWFNVILECFWNNFFRKFVAEDVKSLLNLYWNVEKLDIGSTPPEVNNVHLSGSRTDVTLDLNISAKLVPDIQITILNGYAVMGLKRFILCGVFRVKFEPLLLSNDNLCSYVTVLQNTWRTVRISATQRPLIDYEFTGLLMFLNGVKPLVNLLVGRLLDYPNGITFRHGERNFDHFKFLLDHDRRLLLLLQDYHGSQVDYQGLTVTTKSPLTPFDSWRLQNHCLQQTLHLYLLPTTEVTEGGVKPSSQLAFITKSAAEFDNKGTDKYLI
jgi:hypothetical protein